jgi:hypothetical protein
LEILLENGFHRRAAFSEVKPQYCHLDPEVVKNIRWDS